MYNIADWQHNDNLKRKQELEKEGFVFNITSDGYSLYFKEKFLHGAGVMLPRQSTKRRTMHHKIADCRDHLNICIIDANRYKETVNVK